MVPGTARGRKRSIQDPPDLSSVISEFEQDRPRLQRLIEELELTEEKQPKSQSKSWKGVLVGLIILVALLTAFGLTLLAAKFYDNLFRVVHGTSTDSTALLALVVVVLTLAGFVLVIVLMLELMSSKSEEIVDKEALTEELRSTVQILKQRLDQVDGQKWVQLGLEAGLLGLRSRVESLVSLLEAAQGELSALQVSELQKRFRKTVEEVDRVRAQMQLSPES